MRSSRNVAIAAVLFVLAGAAVAAAWLDEWAIAATGLGALGFLAGLLALWAGVRAGQADRAVTRRIATTEKALTARFEAQMATLAESLTAALTDTVVPALNRVESATANTGAEAQLALTELRDSAIRKPGEVVLNAHEVVGMLRTIQAQHVGRLDRAQDALDAAIARLEHQNR